MLLSRVVFPQPTNLYTFAPEVGLGVDVGLAGGGRIAARGDTVYVVWYTGSTYCQKSTDGGQTFGPPVRVNSTPYGAGLMKMDTAGVLYVTFEYGGDIYFTKSTDGGSSFIPAVKVSDDTIPTRGQVGPVIAVNNKGQIFIVWNDQRNAPPSEYGSVFTAASYDGGGTFTPNVQVNDSLTPAGLYDIGADDKGHVYVAWSSSPTLFVSRSSDSGQSFPFRVPVGGDANEIAIAAGDSAVGVAWGLAGWAPLRFSVSHNYGETFSPAIAVDSNFPLLSELLWEKGVFFITWEGFHQPIPSNGVRDHIHFTYSIDGGQSFVPLVEAVTSDTADLAYQNGGSLAINEEGKAFVVFKDSRYDWGFDLLWYLFVSVGTPSLVKGDLNLDGNLTVADAVMELNAVYLARPYPAPFGSADVNCDLGLTAADVVLHLNATYLAEPFPCI